MRQTTKKLAILAMALALLIQTAVLTAVEAAPPAQNQSKLTKHDRELLSDAVAQGKSTVTVLIAAQPGANNSVTSGLSGLGATVRFRDDDISYIRAIVPTGNVDAASKLSGIQAFNLDEVIPLEDPRPDAAEGSFDLNAVPTPPGPGTPNENPYMPTRDIGAPQFVAAHPTWDGRGVTIGILDTGIDLAHPALQTTSTGEPD